MSTFIKTTREEAREALKYATSTVLEYTEKTISVAGIRYNYCGEPVRYMNADIPVTAYVVGVSEKGRDFDPVVLEYV